MRDWRRGVAAVGAGALLSLLGGCGSGSDTSSTGFSAVTVTGEREEQVPGNRCAVQGHATNTGNNRARVSLAYEAKNSSGAVIATSTAEFEVAPFSNFDFSNAVLNTEGQPASTVFSNNVSCAAVDDIHRTRLDVHAA